MGQELDFFSVFLTTIYHGAFMTLETRKSQVEFIALGEFRDAAKSQPWHVGNNSVTRCTAVQLNSKLLGRRDFVPFVSFFFFLVSIF